MRESSGHDADADLVLLGRIEDPRSLPQRRHRHADRRLPVGMADREQAEQQQSSDAGRTFDYHKNLPGPKLMAQLPSECGAAPLEEPMG